MAVEKIDECSEMINREVLTSNRRHGIRADKRYRKVTADGPWESGTICGNIGSARRRLCIQIFALEFATRDMAELRRSI